MPIAKVNGVETRFEPGLKRLRLMPCLALIGLGLAACEERSEPEAAPAPAVASATDAPGMTAESLTSACRQAAGRLSGQGGEAIRVEPVGDAAATVSWPFDGGRLTLNCTVDGDRVALSYDSGQPAVGFTPPAAEAAQQEAR